MPEYTPLPFSEAIEYFRKKMPVSREEFRALQEEARAKAFTFFSAHTRTIAAEMKTKIQKALQEGQSFQEFKNSLPEMKEALGFGKKPWRLETLFRTNVISSYQAGRYEQMSDAEVLARRPYWQYVAVMDERTRDEHAEMNGAVYPAEHSFWDEWYPPNGYNCRCEVVTVSEGEVKEEGLNIRKNLPEIHPDPAFRYNPAKGMSGDLVRKAIEKDLERFVPILGGKTWKDYGRPEFPPEEVALEAPGMVPRNKDLGYYKKVWGIPEGKREVLVKDPRGELVSLSEGAILHYMGREKERVQFLRHVRMAVEKPWEIWADEYRDKKTGSIRYQVQYLAIFSGKPRYFVAAKKINHWVILTSHPIKEKRWREFLNKRKGILLYGR